MCKELNIAGIVDELMPKQSTERNISYGEALVVMVINGLGFASRTLHMFPEFFANKPLDRLIRPGIEAHHLNDNVLGRALDKFYEFDVSELYLNIAESAVSKLNLQPKSLHMNSTSFHVDGQYNNQSDDDACIKITCGYSRDHRPELNKVILDRNLCLAQTPLL